MVLPFQKSNQITDNKGKMIQFFLIFGKICYVEKVFFQRKIFWILLAHKNINHLLAFFFNLRFSFVCLHMSTKNSRLHIRKKSVPKKLYSKSHALLFAEVLFRGVVFFILVVYQISIITWKRIVIAYQP